MNSIKIFSLIGIVAFLSSCTENPQIKAEVLNENENEKQFVQVLEKHLEAVQNRDLEALKSTMSPDGKMQLIMQGSEIIHKVDGFMEFHKGWFEGGEWTIENEILSTEISDELGLAVVESMYREPERNGKPYFNKMIVTYVLQNKDGKWSIINDHASSIVRSTDKQQ